MTMISKAAVGIAVGIAGIFVGYCFYFDQKRRSEPDFKKKLRERRKARKQAQKAASRIPDLKDQEVVQRFFLQEVQLGEEMLSCGDLEGGVEHLSNAVAVCGQPQQLLQVLQKTLPPQVFELLLQRIQSAGQKLMTHAVVAEDDVE
ncbi:mitochondrial import receptor subunit TOM20 homolog B [Orussus abietinus]|uniref:mitochondrial import receptor subunit TOM20 homolog B n=1 Tax=Orussus abietinus TaxID=222816 RepID=UPI0006252862|nr:mitochondrial import receptor subunit TOM20 homolog B [Orussus abietinus]